jgi:TonB family protein
MKSPLLGISIIAFSCLCTDCNQGQTTPQQVLGGNEGSQHIPVLQKSANEVCDFSQFSPLRGDFDSHPNPNDRIAMPIYPGEARRAGIEGMVTVKVLVNGEGSVTRVCVESGDPRLVEASAEAAQKSKFVPLFLNEKAVPYVERTIRFKYVLSEQQTELVRQQTAVAPGKQHSKPLERTAEKRGRSAPESLSGRE